MNFTHSAKKFWPLFGIAPIKYKGGQVLLPGGEVLYLVIPHGLEHNGFTTKVLHVFT